VCLCGRKRTRPLPRAAAAKASYTDHYAVDSAPACLVKHVVSTTASPPKAFQQLRTWPCAGSSYQPPRSRSFSCCQSRHEVLAQEVTSTDAQLVALAGPLVEPHAPGRVLRASRKPARSTRVQRPSPRREMSLNACHATVELGQDSPAHHGLVDGQCNSVLGHAAPPSATGQTCHERKSSTNVVCDGDISFLRKGEAAAVEHCSGA
jgi:hypothetical protein